MGIVDVRPHDSLSKIHACIVAGDTLAIYFDRCFHVNLTNFSDQDVYVHKHQKTAVSVEERRERVCGKDNSVKSL